MDCRTCQPSLIDLLQGELALEAANQAREHIAHCANCKGALDKLTRGLKHAQQLPLDEPPQAVTARLLQMADEQARRAAALRKPRGAPTVWQALLDFIGRFAAARQVGMVTITLLIMAVGLWSLPQLKHAPVAVAPTVVHPDETEEALPSSPGVEPAQPLDLKVDLRAGRIRSREEMASAPSPAAAAQAPAEPDFAAASAPAEGLAMAERTARRRAAGDKARAFEGAEAEKSSAVGAGALAQRGAPSPKTVQPAAKPAPFPRNEAPAAPAASSPRSIDDLLDGSLSSGRAVSSEQAASAGPPAKKGEASSAAAAAASALVDARATSASRGCSAALPEYERIVRAAPASAAAGAALIDMANCASGRGEVERARSLLSRAAQIPQVSRRASDLLARLPETREMKKSKAAAATVDDKQGP